MGLFYRARKLDQAPSDSETLQLYPLLHRRVAIFSLLLWKARSLSKRVLLSLSFPSHSGPYNSLSLSTSYRILPIIFDDRLII